MNANAPTDAPKKGLAITSLVLGLLGILCFGLITGLPAVICGHIARSRARRDPSRYSGGGLALAGLVLGYASIITSLLMVPLLISSLSKAKSRAESFGCVNNLKQIGMAYNVWAADHGGLYPASVSTNDGGALELSGTASRSRLIQDPVPQFMVLSNELATPRILVCPRDGSKSAATSFELLTHANVSYLVSGYAGVETNLTERFIVCPIHNLGLLVDGTIEGLGR